MVFHLNIIKISQVILPKQLFYEKVRNGDRSSNPVKIKINADSNKLH